MSLGEAHARLTAPGAAFETVPAMVRGVEMQVWKQVPATAAEAFARVRDHGAREFLIYNHERVSYDAFARAVLAVAALLTERGVRKGDRVALVMRNLPEWPVIFMGALLAGAIAVPLNAWWASAELAFAIQDCGARLVFADGERLARLDGLPAQIVVTRAIAAPSGVTLLEDVIGTPLQWQNLPQGRLPDVVLNPEDDATIFYTSGTTAAPKGALGTHRSLTTNIFAAPFSEARNALRRGEPGPASPSRAAQEGEVAVAALAMRRVRLAAKPTERPAPSGAQAGSEGVKQSQRVTLLAVPFFHVIGSLSVLLPNMVAGGKLVLMHKFAPEQALALIKQEGVTVAGGVPSVPLALLEQAEGHDLSSLQLVNFGGAPSPPSLAERIRQILDAMPGQGWGMTETSATCTTHSAEDYLHRAESCGPALPVSRLKIIKDGVEQPSGRAGELWAFGPNIVKGYWNRPEATAAAFQGGWLKTGDLAVLDEEGFCTILDRGEDMLIRGGENIYCIEVENVLLQHPAVADAALVGLPHPILGEVPAALVQTRPGAQVSEGELKDFTATRLAAFKVPTQVRIGPDLLPRNEGGKLVKSEMRKVFA